jgi:hypothetical protein
LKPQDIVVVLKLSFEPGFPTFAALGAQLGISASEVHGAMNRAAAATLLNLETRKPRVRNLLEFLEHGIRYVFVSRRGEITRGIPTAHSAPPLNALLVQGSASPSGPLARMLGDQPAEGPLARMFAQMPEPPLVWPHPDGDVRGESLEPLYPSAVDAARRDRKLYECLALVDALRVGRARERSLAIDLLTKRLRAP